MKTENIFEQRLNNILEQLSSDQCEELFELLLTDERFQPEGYPWNYASKYSVSALTEEETKFLHDKFIDIQYSEDPTLQGEDIRGVVIYPYI